MDAIQTGGNQRRSRLIPHFPVDCELSGSQAVPRYKILHFVPVAVHNPDAHIRLFGQSKLQRHLRCGRVRKGRPQRQRVVCCRRGNHYPSAPAAGSRFGQARQPVCRIVLDKGTVLCGPGNAGNRRIVRLGGAAAGGQEGDRQNKSHPPQNKGRHRQNRFHNG